MDAALPDLLQLEAAAEAADLSVVGPRDSRVQEIDGHLFPFGLICHLCRDFGDGRCAGCTGTLIAPNLVLTAAHCLWSHARRAAPRSITVMPGRTDRDTLPFGRRAGHRFWVPHGFIDGPNHMLWDFGVILLERPFPHARRFMPMVARSDPELAQIATDQRVAIVGYPGDRPIGTLWRHEERIKKVTPRRLLYSIDTCPGHSGSPVIAGLGRRPEILAVHTMGILDAEGRSFGCGRQTVLAPPGLLNSGIRLTPAVIQRVLDPARPGWGPWRMRAFASTQK
ncbi:trypsin-like serine peptidase [Geminicoccus roseus]|uniref:trypsin-like serine peptidase n=1 Tax=Geminicoccus roseus TaxID=404900 RepID=UPI00040C43F1|nr:trypsin-like serine protease [Geminicoccus roseus]